MRTFLLIMLLMLASIPDGRGSTVDVYTGEAAVVSKDAGERDQALAQALRNVLEKMSGLRSFEEFPLVEPALQQAPAITLSFFYRNGEVVLADGSTLNELRLVAKFSAPRVDEMMRSVGLPLWPAERQSTDIWVVVDNGLDRRVMPVEFAYAWQSMDEAAARRGLPVNWPEPDEEGMYFIDAQLLWGGYTEDLGLAPGRGAVIMAARREGFEWGVRSNMSYGGESWTWRVQDLDLQAALIESVQQAADRVAAANTIAASDMGAWVFDLNVAGLRNSADYERCLAYLQGLGLVTEVAVISANPGKATFRLQLNAVPRYLEETLQGGQILRFDQAERQYFLLQ